MNARMNHFRPLPAAILLLAAWLPVPAGAQVRILADAVTGEPFGVGRLTLVMPKELLPVPLGIEAIGLNEKSGRALYPAINKPVAGRLVKDFLDIQSPLTTGGPVRDEVSGLLRGILDRPPRTAIYFLFRGTGSLELTLQCRSPQTMVITPRNDPAAHKRLLQAWWSQYAASFRPLQEKPDYPPLVDNYLTTTLARRLVLELPKKQQTESWQDALMEELGLMTGTESIRIAMQQDRILGLNNLHLPADQPLPEQPTPAALQFPPVADDVEIEPIALRVPNECYYVRFGSFSNFLWMQDTLEKWGGDLQNLLGARGLDYQLGRRMEDELVTKQTEIARMFGGAMISDVAIIGTDVFSREGAAYGLMFHAAQSTALGAGLVQQRLERLGQGGVTEKKLEIGGHTVSFLSAPDGSVRSYYAADGDYHFMTTSKTLAMRFLQTGSGIGALGTSKDFRYTRSVMPLSREDTVFVYLSDAFFRNVTGPRYRVEMARRLQAAADVDLVQLAVLASATEGKPGETIEELIAGGLLPGSFGPRPDGSRTVLKDGQVYDRLRGHRGMFLPVSDTPVGRVTRAEASVYRKFADVFQEKWDGRMDPTIIGIKREALPENREKVVLDVQLSPFAAEHFNFLSQWAGPPDKMQLVPIPGDMVAGELVLQDQHLFGGLADFGPPPQIGDGRLFPLGRLRDALVGYLGTTGQLGLLGVLDAMITTRPDARGYAGSQLGPWRRQFDGFTVYSLHPEVLAAVTPQLRFVEARRPAQLRLRIDDLTRAKMTPWLNGLGYARTRETSLGNLRLMSALDQQLHVPPEDCMDAAEFLLDAKLVCPLGGDYVFGKTAAGGGWWTSTALQTGGVRQPPPGYQAPPLNWFRGLQLDATMTRKVLSAHAEIIMQLPAVATSERNGVSDATAGKPAR